MKIREDANLEELVDISIQREFASHLVNWALVHIIISAVFGILLDFATNLRRMETVSVVKCVSFVIL